jgi:hypothetical protein
MKRWIMTVIVIVAVAVVVMQGQAQQARPNANRQKWEYAEWQYSVLGNRFFAYFKSSQQKTTKEGDNANFDLYKSLGGKADVNNFSSQNILDMLGDDGWELIIKDQTGGTVQTLTYVFKRPKN